MSLRISFCWELADGFSSPLTGGVKGRHRGNCRVNDAITRLARRSSPFSPVSPPFNGILSSNIVKFPCGHLPLCLAEFISPQSFSPGIPRVFSLSTGGPSGKERTFGSEVQTFQGKRWILPYFFCIFAIVLPYIFRTIAALFP